MLVKHPNILFESDVSGLAPKTIMLNYKLFQASHASSLPPSFRPPRPRSQPTSKNLNISAMGLHLSHVISYLYGST